jgi:hypothetical protein
MVICLGTLVAPMISIVLTEEDTEVYHLDTVQGLFSREATSITGTEATPATGTIETITGTETIIGIETEAGTEVTIATEIGTTTVTVAEPKTEITTETITTAEIRDLRTIETIAVAEIRDLRIVEAMAAVEFRGQMITEATQVVGEVVAREAMPLVQHLRETEIVEQKLQALHQEVVRATRERKYKLRDHLPKALTMGRVEAMIAEEEACLIEVKPTIRVEEGIISDNKNGDFGRHFCVKTKAEIFHLEKLGDLWLPQNVLLFAFLYWDRGYNLL